MMALAVGAVATVWAVGAAAEPEHPGHATGYDTLFSRRLGRYFFQQRASGDVHWDMPAVRATAA